MNLLSIDQKMKRLKPIIYLLLMIGVNSCNSLTPERDRGDEEIRDFAPLEIGNIWEYEFIQKVSPSHIFYYSIQSIMTVTLLSIEYLNDLTNYTFSVKDSGAPLLTLSLPHLTITRDDKTFNLLGSVLNVNRVSRLPPVLNQ